MSKFARPCWLEISKGAIIHNLSTIRKSVGDKVTICPVLKGNAYGHGCGEVADVVVNAGAQRIAVATLYEAAIMRNEKGVACPIHVLGPLHPFDALDAMELDVIPTVSTIEGAANFAIHAKGRKVHVKLDTGMNRVGVQPNDLASTISTLKQLGLEVEGVFTHFASADCDEELTNKQISLFKSTVSKLPENLRPAMLHACNSAGTLAYSQAHFDMVRPGLAVYGLPPSPEFTKYGLMPAMRMRARPTLVKRVRKGDLIGYGASFIAKEDIWVATMPFGYADGYRRSWSNSSIVRLVEKDGNRIDCPVVGRVSMDQTTVQVPYEIGLDSVFDIFTADLDPDTSFTGRADQSDTINWELLTSCSWRVPRFYVDDFNDIVKRRVNAPQGEAEAGL